MLVHHIRSNPEPPIASLTSLPSPVFPLSSLVSPLSSPFSPLSPVHQGRAHFLALPFKTCTNPHAATPPSTDFALVSASLEDDVPCYILFRVDSSSRRPPEEWLLMSWVPENAKVRLKMIYASSRDALKKEFGSAPRTLKPGR